MPLVAGTELADDRNDVRFHGRLGDEQPCGDFGVGIPLSRQPDDRHLLLSQRVAKRSIDGSSVETVLSRHSPQPFLLRFLRSRFACLAVRFKPPCGVVR